MLTKKDLSPEIHKKIKEEYYKGLKFKAISEKWNCSERAVAFSLKEQGVNTRLKNRYLINENYFEKMNSEYKKYILGIINADGCLSVNNYFALQLIDLNIIERLAKELNVKSLVRKVNRSNGYPTNKDSYRLNFSNEKIWKDLTKNKAKDLLWKGINLKKKGTYNWSFLLGFFDGDGCVYLNKKRSGGIINIIAPHEVCKKIQNFTKMGSLIQHDEHLSYWRIFGKKDFEMFYTNCYKENLGLQRKKKKIERLIESYENHKKRKIK